MIQMRFETERALSTEVYADLADQLKVYDVDQNGWEHENKGLEFNTTHVLKELVRARRKDMFEPTVVEGESAPDAVQYALRFGRWASISTGLLLPTVETDIEADAYCNMNDYHRTRLGGWALAEIKLADFAHKLDHKSERDIGLRNAPSDLTKVSGFLIYFAELSAKEFNFDLRTAFRDRLANLRERFGIPQPS